MRCLRCSQRRALLGFGGAASMRNASGGPSAAPRRRTPGWIICAVFSLRTALDSLYARTHGHQRKKLLDRIGSRISIYRTRRRTPGRNSDERPHACRATPESNNECRNTPLVVCTTSDQRFAKTQAVDCRGGRTSEELPSAA